MSKEIDYKKELELLLNIIHMDDGEFIEKHGIEKAIIDAKNIHYRLKEEVDVIEDVYAIIQKRTELNME